MLFRSRNRLPARRVYLIRSFSGAFFSTMVFTVASIFAVTEAGLSPLQLVLVGTALESSAFLFEVPTGVVADVYSRRLSVVIGNFIIAAGFLVWGALPLFATILLAQILWGIGYTFTSGAEEAWIADEVGEERVGALYLRAAQAGQLGTLLGIPASVLLGTAHLQLPMLLGGVGLLGQATFLALCMPEHGFTPTPSADRNSWQKMGHTLASGLGEVRRRPVLVTILAIALIFGAASEAYDRLRDAHLLENFSFPAFGGWEPVVWFGIIGVVGLVLSMATTEVVRRRLDTSSHVSAARALLLLDTSLMVAVIVFAVAGSFGVAVAAVWAGAVLRRVNIPLSTAWINQGLEPSVRATVISMRGQADALGQIVGGPVLGVVASAVSIRAALVCSGAVLSLALPFYARTLRRREPEAAAELV